MAALPTPGGNKSQALGVNNLGQVVGFAEEATKDPNCVPPQVLDIQAVIWGPKAGEIQTLTPLVGDISAWAIGINDAGQIVGLSGNCVSPNFNAACATTPQHGVIWQNSTVTNIGTLGGSFVFPWAINSRGQVTGQSAPPGDTTIHAFSWQKGLMSDLGVVLGDFFSIGFGLNHAGEVVGGSADQNLSNTRAFLWRNGSMVDLNSLVKPASTSLHLVFGNDINSLGEIAAYAFDQRSGEFHAAVAIPCDQQHADVELCSGSTNSMVGTTNQTRTFVLPENARQQVSQRLVLWRIRSGLLNP
jgi:probable HAF family extracellular repeat protein